jgi:hypothetical protein
MAREQKRAESKHAEAAQTAASNETILRKVDLAQHECSMKPSITNRSAWITAMLTAGEIKKRESANVAQGTRGNQATITDVMAKGSLDLDAKSKARKTTKVTIQLTEELKKERKLMILVRSSAPVKHMADAYQSSFTPINMLKSVMQIESNSFMSWRVV